MDQVKYSSIKLTGSGCSVVLWVAPPPNSICCASDVNTYCLYRTMQRVGVSALFLLYWHLLNAARVSRTWETRHRYATAEVKAGEGPSSSAVVGCQSADFSSEKQVREGWKKIRKRREKTNKEERRMVRFYLYAVLHTGRRWAMKMHFFFFKTKQRVKRRENYDLVQVKMIRKEVMYVRIVF